MTAQPTDPGLRQFALDATRRAEEAEARLEELLDPLEDTGITSGMSDAQLHQVPGRRARRTTPRREAPDHR